jgi:hypothetical protein
MKKLFIIPFIFAVIAIFSIGVLAQEKPDGKNDAVKVEEDEHAKENKKIDDAIREIYKRLHIGVLIYMDWIGQWGHKDPSSFNRVTNGQPDPGKISPTGIAPGGEFKGKNNNEFRIDRAYLDVKYAISDIFSARLTTDVDASITPSNDPNAAFHIFLKFAYIEAKKDFGPVRLSAAGGMVETPIIGEIYKINDYRWIDKNYIDQSKNIISQSIDNSVDLGVNASIGIMNHVTLSGSFTNGTGYKNDESNSYKAVTYLAVINPIKEIYIIGFGRNEITAKYDFTGKKARREYYGYGLAYSSDLIKVGVIHVFPYVTTVGVASYFNPSWKFPFWGSPDIYAYPTHRNGYMIIESFFNFNLGAVIPTAPLIIAGRVVYGLQRGTYQRLITDTECGKERISLLYAIGVGWQFSKNFRIFIGGEVQQYVVKKNRVLRYEETDGTDYWSNGVESVFTGSHNPHDTKRVYVKAEVAF